MLGFAHMLGSAWAASPAAESSLATPTALGVITAAAIAACILFGVRFRQERRRSLKLEAERASRSTTEADFQSRERALKATLNERRDELQALKQDLGAQRKKNHLLQEELGKLRDGLREQTRLRQEAQTLRPAFADMDIKPAGVKTRAPAVVEPKPAPPPPPAPKIVEAPEVDPALAAAEAAAQARLANLQKDLEAARTALQLERTTTAAQKDELKKMRRRAEDLRRIDIITKSKTELLEDKLRGLGRQYYDAISELAAARGEVVPPRPRDLPPEPTITADADAEAEAESQALADADGVDQDNTADTEPEHEASLKIDRDLEPGAGASA